MKPPNLRTAAVDEDAELRLVCEERCRVERCLTILVAQPDVGALSEQEFGDGRIPG